MEDQLTLTAQGGPSPAARPAAFVGCAVVPIPIVSGWLPTGSARQRHERDPDHSDRRGTDCPGSAVIERFTDAALVRIATVGHRKRFRIARRTSGMNL